MTKASLWTSPQVNSTTKTAKRINNLTNVTNQIAIYTSTITINSFIKSHSGNYTCTANTNSTTVLITTGKYNIYSAHTMESLMYNGIPDVYQ